MIFLQRKHRLGLASNPSARSPVTTAVRARNHAGRSREQSFDFQRLEARQLMAVDLEQVSTWGTTGADGVNSVVLDDSGNVYTTGYFSGTVDFDPGPSTTQLTSAGGKDIFVTKSDPQGNLLWARRLGGSADDVGISVHVRPNSGDVVTIGQFQGSIDLDPGAGTVLRNSNGNNDIFVSLLSSAGNYLNGLSFGGAGSETVVADASRSSILLAGSFEGTVDFNPEAPVLNLVSAGVADCYSLVLGWNLSFFSAHRWGGSGWDFVDAAAINDQGGYFIAGSFQGTVDFNPGAGTFNMTSASSDAFIMACEPLQDNNFRWAKRFSHNLPGFRNTIGALEIDLENNVYLGGTFYYTTDFDLGTGVANLTSLGNGDLFVAKYDHAGDYKWARAFHGPSYSQDLIDIAVGPDQRVYAIGNFYDTIDFDPGVGTALLQSSGGAYLSQLDEAGNYVHAALISGGPSTSGPQSIQVDAQGYVFVGGNFRSQSDFDPGLDTLIRSASGSLEDAFVTKLGPDAKYSLGPVSGNDVVLRRNGTRVELVNAANNQVVESFPAANIRHFEITGVANTTDKLLIDLAFGGQLSLGGEVRFTGGTETSGTGDQLQIRGLPNLAAIYQPGQDANGTNRLLAGSQTVTVSDVESILLSRFVSLNYEPLGSADVLTVQGTIGMGGVLASQFNGTTGGVVTIPLTFDNIRNLVVDMGLSDGTQAQSNDSLTFAAGSLEPVGLQNITVLGGKGADNLVVNSTDLGLPQSGGVFRFEGGAGNDRIAVTGDTELRLNDLRLTSVAGGFILHDEVERAALNGGAGNNLLIGVGYSGALTLNGNAGNDILRGGTGSNTLLGGNGDDQLYGNAGADSLDGGIGNDLLYGFDGNDVLLGGAGNDQLFGGFGNDTLNGGDGLDLFWFDGTNNSEALRLQQLTATTATYFRRPRGLTTVLEQDSLVYDATDEVQINAHDGDDFIAIDTTFAMLGSIDGGNGNDGNTAPAAWIKVSC